MPPPLRNILIILIVPTECIGVFRMVLANRLVFVEETLCVSCEVRTEFLHIMTYRPTAMQRLRKHIPAKAYVRKNRTSNARQRISKEAFLTIEKLCFCVVLAEGS
jgi:hypothetical protein